MSRNTNSNNIIEPNNTGRADLTPQELILLSRDLFYAVTTRLPIEDIRNLIDRGADVNTVTHGYTHGEIMNNLLMH